MIHPFLVIQNGVDFLEASCFLDGSIGQSYMTKLLISKIVRWGRLCLDARRSWVPDCSLTSRAWTNCHFEFVKIHKINHEGLETSDTEEWGRCREELSALPELSGKKGNESYVESSIVFVVSVDRNSVAWRHTSRRVRGGRLLTLYSGN